MFWLDKRKKKNMVSIPITADTYFRTIGEVMDVYREK